MGDTFDFIGYQVDRLSELVTVSRRNILKSIYFFNQVNLTDDAKVPVRIMQRLASLGSRYGHICSAMRPFVRTLYESYHGTPQHGSVSLSAAVKVVIAFVRSAGSSRSWVCASASSQGRFIPSSTVTRCGYVNSTLAYRGFALFGSSGHPRAKKSHKHGPRWISGTLTSGRTRPSRIHPSTSGVFCVHAVSRASASGMCQSFCAATQSQPSLGLVKAP
jgi:hypothetical protein